MDVVRCAPRRGIACGGLGLDDAVSTRPGLMQRWGREAL